MKIPLVCANPDCRKEFARRPSHVKFSKSYCSSRCYHLSRDACVDRKERILEVLQGKEMDVNEIKKSVGGQVSDSGIRDQLQSLKRAGKVQKVLRPRMGHTHRHIDNQRRGWTVWRLAE